MMAVGVDVVQENRVDSSRKSGFVVDEQRRGLTEVQSQKRKTAV